jgi:uncharacterized membrane protein
MEAKARLFGHPVHQMLIVFPLGLLGTSLAFDAAHMMTDRGEFASVAYWMIAAGVITGLVAAVFGFVDYLAIPRRTRAKKIGALHGIGNIVVVGLFIASGLLRMPDPAGRPGLAVGLSAAAVALALVTGWLGGELVDRLAVGVDEGAHPDAPSSLAVPHLRGDRSRNKAA